MSGRYKISFDFDIVWYHDESCPYRHMFLELGEDECFKEFVKYSEDQFYTNYYTWRQVKTAFAKPFMQWMGYCLTDTLSLLDVGTMHVLSSNQISKLLNVSEEKPLDSLVDIGSGNGEVSKYLTPFFKRAVLTESNKFMVATLTSKGYEAVHCTSIAENKTIQSMRPVSVVSCYNVLDRCDKPMSLLREMREIMDENSKLLITVVLPFHPFVEDGNKQLKPTEYLDVDNCCLESGILTFIEKIFPTAGLEVEKFSRVPYLCEGDHNCSIYSLDSVAFVCTLPKKKTKDPMQDID